MNMVSREYDKKMLSELDAAGRQRLMIHRASVFSNGMIEGVSKLDDQAQQDIMEVCGKVCAIVTGNLAIANELAELPISLEEKLNRLNKSDVWCARWDYDGEYFGAVCTHCGCPLVTEGVVELTGTMCQCSRGWVKTIFETLLQGEVAVDILDSIGLGGENCVFRVKPVTE